jgi:hypothetical protein
MDNDKFINQIHSLIQEFQASNETIDDFLYRKLSDRKDGKACAQKIIDTFKAIDENYNNLQNAKAQGKNRQEWMREKFESEIGNNLAKRDAVGRVLSESIDVLNSDSNGTTLTREFDGIDAIELIDDIDKAIVKNTVDSLTNDQENTDERAN